MDRAGRRVVVTGMGLVTPVGLDVESSWEALREGRGGVGPITLFDAGTLRDADRRRAEGLRPVAGPRRRCDAVGGPRPEYADRAGGRGAGRPGLRPVRRPGDRPDAVRRLPRLGRGAGGLPPVRQPGPPVGRRRPGRHPAVHGPGDGAARPAPRGRAGAGDARRAPRGRLRGEGPNLSCLTACSASAQAIGEAAELIRDGAADVMLAGGVHSMIHPFGMTGFILLTAMSTRNDDPARASRPFDRDRDGFVLGEGGGMLVLESFEHARARGAAILGEVAGQASTADAFRLTDCHDEGRGAVASMRLAPRGRRPRSRGRRLHQRPRHEHEGQRLGRDPGAQARPRRPRVAGAGLEHQEHDRPPDRRRRGRRGDRLPAGDPRRRRAADGEPRPPGRGLRPRLRPPRRARARVDVAMSNSFGFGGQNTTLVLRRFAG